MHKLCEMELIFRNFMESRCSRYEIPILQSRNKNGVQLSTEVERIGRATDRNTRQDQAACQHAVSSRIIKKHNSKQEWTAALQRHQSGKFWTLNAMNGMSHDIVFNEWRHGRYTWFPATAPPAIENN